MQMLLVGRGEALAADRAAQDRPKRVENRHAEDQQRDEDRREEEERLAGELCAGSATDAHRRCRHQQAEQQRPTVAHEDPRRVHIVGKEPDAHPERDHGPEAAGIGGIEHRFIAEPERIQQEGRRSDGHDARREAVETIDQIDDVRHADHPDDRDEERPVGRQEEHVEERHPEHEDRHAGERQDAAGEHHPCDLRRRRDLPKIVDEPDTPHHTRSNNHPHHLGAGRHHVGERRMHGRHRRSDDHTADHRSAARRRRGAGVNMTIGRLHHRAEAR